MRATCGACGIGFDTSRHNARWCSDRCRKRGRRAGIGGVQTPEPPPVAEGPTVATTRAYLADAGALDSVAGASAMALALRLDNPERETGSSLAALVRQFELTLGAAVRGTGATEVDRLRDELAARRAARGWQP